MKVEGDAVLVIERTFNAPPRLVFEAYTKAEHVRRWWAPGSHGEMSVCESDVRVGGTWRYVMKAGGQDVGFSGEYREVTPPSRIVYTSVFDPFPEAVVVCTVTFEDLGDQTRLRASEVYPSKEALDAALASGMESGLRESMEQLGTVVASLV